VTVKVQHAADMQTEEQTYKNNQTISVGVVQGYNLQRNSQHLMKQAVRYQNRKNKIKSTASNNAIKNDIKKRIVNGTKCCYKTNTLVILLTKYMSKPTLIILT
jgi:cytidylate kinase